MYVPPGQYLYVRDDPRRDPINDEISKADLLFQGIPYSMYIARSVLHSNEQSTPESIRKGHYSSENPISGREVSLELQYLALI